MKLISERGNGKLMGLFGEGYIKKQKSPKRPYFLGLKQREHVADIITSVIDSKLNK